MNETEILLKTNDRSNVKTGTFRICSTHLSYMMYMCVYGVSILLTSEYVYDRVALLDPLYENITRGRSNCEFNTSGDTFVSKQKAQKISAEWTLYLSLCTTIPSIFTCLVIGSNSDYYGRKILFIIPNLGQLIKMLIYGLHEIFGWNLWVLLFANLVDGLSGNLFTILIGAASMASDTTTEYKQRSFMIILVNILCTLSMCIATVSSGYLVSQLGFSGTFFLSAGLSTVNFVFIFSMPETLPPTSLRKSTLGYVQNIFKFYYKKTEDNVRHLFVILLLTFIIGGIVQVGRSSVDAIYFINVPFCWDTIDIGVYYGILYGVKPIIALLTVKPMQLYFSDSIISVIIMTLGAGGLALQGIAVETYQLYIGGLLQYGQVTFVALVRAIATKLAPTHQQGAALSSIAAAEATVSLCGGVLLNSVYEATLSVYRGSVYLLMAVAWGLCVLGFLILNFIIRRRLKRRLDIQVTDKIKEYQVDLQN